MKKETLNKRGIKMKLSGFEIKLYDNITPEQWCLCWDDKMLFLEIFLSEGELKIKVDINSTRESVANFYGLPLRMTSTL